MRNSDFQCKILLQHDDLVMSNHRVHDVSVLPGVVFLDICLRALQEKGFPPHEYVFERILFSQPVVTSPSQNQEILVEVALPTEKDGWVKVSSRWENTTAPYTENMFAHLCAASPKSTLTVPNDFKLTATSTIDMSELYQRAKQESICHGPKMRCTGELYLNREQLLAELALEVDEQLPFLMHPAALDATTIAAFGQTPETFIDPFIPVSIARFAMLRPLPGAFTQFCPRKEVKSDNGEIVKNDYLLLNPEGETCVVVEELTCKRIRHAGLITHLLETTVHNTNPSPNETGLTPSEEEFSDYATLLTSWITKILQCRPEEIDINAGFYNLGLDSGSLLHIAERLTSELAIDVYPTLLFEYSDIHTLSHYLEQTFGDMPTKAKRPLHTTDDNKPLIHTLAGIDWIVDQRDTLTQIGNKNVVVIGAKPSQVDMLSRSIPKTWQLTSKNKFEERLVTHPNVDSIVFCMDELLVTEGVRESALTTKLHLVSQWFASLSQYKENIDILLVSFTGTDVLLDSVAAFCRSVRVETPRIQARVILVDGKQSGNWLVEELSKSQSVLPVTAGCIQYGTEGVKLKVVVSRPQQIFSDVEDADKKIFRSEGVCVISGAGGISQRLCEALHTKTRVVLLGRRRTSPQWVTSFKDSDVLYYCCDVTDAQAVTDTLATVRNQQGGIDGIIHAAGSLADGLFGNIEAGHIDTVLKPKIAGFTHLDLATKNDPLRYFITFSSLAAWRPNPGQSVYGAANAAVETMTQQRASNPSRHGKSLSIAWPLWAEGGMQLKSEQIHQATRKTGLHPLPTQIAILSLAQMIESPDSRLVSLYGDNTLYHAWVESPEYVVSQPKVQTQCDTPWSRPPEEKGIAIVGLSGRFPGAQDIYAFWRGLRQGYDAVSDIPSDRWDHDAIFDPRKGQPGKTYSRWGGFLSDIDVFDAKMFNISRREAQNMDPQERIFLECCWGLMEEAGYPVNTMKGQDIGVYVGVMWNHYQLYNSEREPSPTAMHAAIANRVSYSFDLKGPSMAVDTACSSSLTSLQLAVDAIQNGQCRMAIAGGVNLAVHPEKYLQLGRTQFLSMDGKCRSFGENGSGYVPGEGVGAVLLKTLEQAIEDKDHIWGVIRSGMIKHGGASGGFTVPNPAAQAEIIQQTWQRAGLELSTLDYLEAHGTGTSLGDPIEIEGIRKAMGDTCQQPTIVGSVKSNIGHLESAAGIASVAKVLLMLKHQSIPASLHSQTLNPRLPLSNSGIRIPQNFEPWTRRSDDTALRAGISSFGAGGTNTHMIIDEYIPPSGVTIDVTGSMLCPFSAPDDESLVDYLTRFTHFLEEQVLIHKENGIQIWLAGQLGLELKEIDSHESLTQLGVDGTLLQVLQSRCKTEIDPDRPIAELNNVFVSEPHDTRLAQIACQLQLNRTHFPNRFACVVETIEQLHQCLLNHLSERGTPGSKGKVVVVSEHASLIEQATQWLDALPVDFNVFWPQQLPKLTMPVPQLVRAHRYWFGAWQDSDSKHSENVQHHHASISVNYVEPHKTNSGSLGEDMNQKSPENPGILSLQMLQDGVALVTMQDHQNYNMFTPQLLEDLEKAFNIINANAEIRAVVLTGSERVFSLGGTPETLKRLACKDFTFTSVPFLYEGLHNCRVPVVAAIRGQASGGGLTFGLHADVVVMDESGTYSANFVKFGFTPGLGATYIFAHHFGSNLANEMCMSGMDYSGSDLAKKGSTIRFESRDKVLDSALSIARAIASNPASAVRELKRENARKAKAELAECIQREVLMHNEVLDESVVTTVKQRAEFATAPVTTPIAASPTAASETATVPMSEVNQQFTSEVQQLIVNALCRILYMQVDEIDLSQTFNEMGLDSLGAVEIIREINEVYSSEFDSVLIYDHPTVPALLDKVVSILGLTTAVPNRAAIAPEGGKISLNQSVMRSQVKEEDIVDSKPVSTSPQSNTSAAWTETQVSVEPLSILGAETLETETAERITLRSIDDMSEKSPSVASSQQGFYIAEHAEAYDDEDIAIIGMSSKYAGCDDIDSFWASLKHGGFQLHKNTDNRWNNPDLFSRDGKTSSFVDSQWVGFINDIDQFDPVFFGISPREAELMDPQQRIFLEQAWKALEHGGYALGPDKRVNCGVFVGTASGDYLPMLRDAGVGNTGQVFLGNSGSILAGRIAYFLNLEGPTVALDTACSSSMVAVHLACQSIKSGDCDMALAGGIALMVSPQMYTWNNNSGMLSDNGRCAAFDHEADGFALGEGVGTVLVKRLSDAIRDRDEIYAVIKASGINGDGKSNGITAPCAEAQLQLQRRVHKRSGVSIDDIGYIETHGAGTQLGDPIEVKALSGLLANRSKSVGPCGIGSIKSNFGHTTLASGVAGLMKVTLGLKHNLIPKSLHFERLNTNIKMDPEKLEVVSVPKVWPLGPRQLRYAAVNNFGVSGTNSHAVLVQAPRIASSIDFIDDAGLLLPISAKTSKALKRNIEGLLSDIRLGHSLTDIAYTLANARAHFKKRCVVIATNRDDAIVCLERLLSEEQQEGVFGYTSIVSSDVYLDVSQRFDLSQLTLFGYQYCQGELVDFGSFYHQRPGRRVPLTGYWLNRRRFWIPETDERTTSIDPGLEQVSAEMKQETNKPEVKVVEIFDPQTLWVSEHRVHHEMVIPGAALIHWALTQSSDSSVSTIKDITWNQVKAVTDRQGIRLSKSRSETHLSEWRFLLDDETCWGQCGYVSGTQTTRTPVVTLPKDNVFTQTISGEQLYQRFSASGIHYGPTYQLLDDIRIGHKIAFVTLGNHRGSSVQLFDAVLQSVASLVTTDKTLLPSSISSLTIWGELQYANHVLIKEVGKDRFDLRIMDKQGQLVLEIEGFALRPLTKEHTIGYRPLWKHVSTPIRTPDAPQQTIEYNGQTHQLRKVDQTSGLVVLDVRHAPDGEIEDSLQTLLEFSRQCLLDTPNEKDLILLTSGAQSINAGERIRPSQAAIQQFLNSIWAETSNQFTAIDVGEEEHTLDVSSLPMGFSNIPVLAYRQGKFYHQQFMALELAQHSGYPSQIGNTFLIVGGTGGIGLAYSQYLASHNKVKIAWVGRRELDQDIQVKMQSIRQLGSDIVYIQGDVSDRLSIDQAVKQVRTSLGPIDCVLHSALVLDDVSFKDMTNKQLKSVLAPKLRGIENLYTATESEPLARFMAFSSVASFMRAPGQSNYAAASSYVDSYLQYLKSNFDVPTCLVNWGYWGSIGIVSDPHHQQMMQRKGVGSIEPDVGFQWLSLQLHQSISQMMVFNTNPSQLTDFGIQLTTPAQSEKESPMPSTSQDKQHTPLLKPLNSSHKTTDKVSGSTLANVRDVFSKILKIDVSDLDDQEPFESYGVDSLLAMDIVRELRKIWQSVPATILYECLTIEEIANRLGDTSLVQTNDIDSSERNVGAPTKLITKHVETYIKSLFSRILKIPEDELESDESFENYGVDSLLAMDILKGLKADLGDLPATLLYQKLTIGELVTYLCEEKSQELSTSFEVASKKLAPETRETTISHPVANAEDELMAHNQGILGNTSVQASTVASHRQSSNEHQNDIAVIGLSGRYPGAGNLDEFWSNLSQGKRSIIKAPEVRGDWSAYFSEKPKDNHSYNIHGGFLNNIEYFDAKFFNILPSDAKTIDPQERLFLEQCWDLLESAGCNGTYSHEPETGVFVGSMYASYGQLAAANGWQNGEFNLGHSPQWSIANRVSYCFDFTGPSMTIDSACSSSMTAFHQACEALKRGECRQAIVGGVNLILHPAHHIALSAMNMLGTGQACRTFDAQADGIVPGEGVITVLLKPLTQAINDGENILAVVKGSMVNAGGRTNGYTVPNPNQQSQVIDKALQRAGIHAHEVDFVEVHGTGTALGDPIEVAALQRVFDVQGRKAPLAVSSVKSNIGHLEGAAGLAGISKAILQLQHQQLVPCSGLNSINDKIDFGHNIHPVTSLTDWSRSGSVAQAPRTCGVSSFGAGGANAHVILQEPSLSSIQPDVEGGHILVLSATSVNQLRDYAKVLEQWLLKHQDVSLSQLCYTSQIGRKEHPIKLAIVTSDVFQLMHELCQFCEGKPSSACHISAKTKVSDLFSDGVSEELMKLFSARRAWDKLAQLWINDISVDWQDFWPSSMRKIAFPTMPLQRRAFWFNDESKTPVITRPTSQWIAQLTQEHVIKGKCLMPGAVSLAYALQNERQGDVSCVTDFKWLRPSFSCKGTHAISLVTKAKTQKTEIRLAGQQKTIANYVTTSSYASMTAPPDVTEYLAKARENVSPHAVYVGLARADMHYGPTLRVLERVQKGDDFIVSSIVVEDPTAPDALARYIDGAMQTISLLSHHESALPKSIAQCYMTGRLTEKMQALVKRENQQETYSIYLFNSHGELTLQINDLQLSTDVKLLLPDQASHLAYLRPEMMKMPLSSHFTTGDLSPIYLHTATQRWASGVKAAAGDAAISILHDQPIPDLDECAQGLLCLDTQSLISQEGIGSHLETLLEVINAVSARRDKQTYQLIVSAMGDDDDAVPIAAAVKCLNKELPWLKGRFVSIDRLENVGKILSEFCDEVPQEDVFWRGQTRWINTFERFEPPKFSDLLIRPSGHYLISGGTGKLGQHFAEHLAKLAPVTVVLLGRSKPSAEQEAWGKEQSINGRHFHFRQADVSDLAMTQAVITSIIDEFGAINGVIHAAGFHKDNLAKNKTASEIQSVLSAKVNGAVNLDHVLAAQPLDFMLLCSSLVAEMGNPGQIDYAVANKFVSNFAGRRNLMCREGKRHGYTSAVAWPLWQDGGMGVDKSTEKVLASHFGMLPLKTQEGLDIFELALSGQLEYFGVFSESPRISKHKAPIHSESGDDHSDTNVQEIATNVLKKVGAEFLLVSPEDIEFNTPLLDLGFDSISLTNMMERINEELHLELLPSVLFECPTLTDVANFIVEEHGAHIAKIHTSPSPEEDPTHMTNLPIDDNIPPSQEKITEVVAVDEKNTNMQAHHQDDIAIVGMAGRFGNTDSILSFWEKLKEQAEFMVPVSEKRAWFAQDNRMSGIQAALIENVDLFDASLFGISRREAILMDPQQRIFLETVTQTLQDAGYSKQALLGARIGVFAGVSTNDYNSIIQKSRDEIEPHMATGIAHSILANRVSHVFDWHGPSEVIDTACSSSLVALNRAIQALRNGECETAIVGGVNLTLTPDLYTAFTKAGMLSPEQRCKTFDASADGYVRGEGCGSIMVKPLSQAIKDNDHVYAVVKGIAVNHGGKSASLTAPNPSSQADVIVQAMQNAKISPRDIGYIETHGTGTKLGDVVEIEGLKKAFEQLMGDVAIDEHDMPWIRLGAVKTSVGHLEAASGIVGVIRTVLSLQYNMLTPNQHFQQLNPKLKLEGTPFKVLEVTQKVSDSPTQNVYAGVSSFGFGGTNAHVILGSVRPNTAPVLTDQPLLFPFSAQSCSALETYLLSMLSYCKGECAPLSDISYTLKHGRDGFPCRAMVIARNLADLTAGLNTLIERVKGQDDGLLTDLSNSDLTHAENMLVTQWLAGNVVTWGINNGTRCSLPTIPFERQPYWAGEYKNIKVTSMIENTKNPHRPETPSVQLRSLEETSTPSETVSEKSGISMPKENQAYPGHVVHREEQPSDVDLHTFLLASLSTILLCDEDEIDSEKSFSDLGLDSILRLDLVRKINEQYQIELVAETLYEYDSVSALLSPLSAILPHSTACDVDSSEQIEVAQTSKVDSRDQEHSKRLTSGARSLETMICDIVTRVTGHSLSVDTDFFDAGLTSFDMLKLIAEMERLLGPLTKTLLFDRPTPKHLSAWLLDTHSSEKLLTLEKLSHAASLQTNQIGEIEILGNDAVVIAKQHLDEHPEIATRVRKMEEDWAKEGGLPGRDIAPYMFIGANDCGIIHFAERDGLLLSWNLTAEDSLFETLVTQWTDWAYSRELRPNLLSMKPLNMVAGRPFSSTSFGTVQRLNDISSYNLEGKIFSRLRKKINKFSRSGEINVSEYKIGTNPKIDAEIVEMIDQWVASKKMVNPYVKRVRQEILEGYMEDRHRVFVTHTDGYMVSAIVITKIPSVNGYLLDLEFFGDRMENGGLDYSINEIIQRLNQEGVTMFSFGATLGVKVCDSPNPSPAVEEVLNELKETGIFKGDGNFQFKNKYRPENLPVYLCQPEDVSPADISALLLLIANPTLKSKDGKSSHVPTEQPQSTVLDIQPSIGDTVTQLPEPILQRDTGINLVSDSWAERNDRFIGPRMAAITEKAVDVNEASTCVMPFNYLHFASSGKHAEEILLKTLDRSKRMILQNNLFPSWTFNCLDLDVTPQLMKSCAQTGIIDLAHLSLLLETHAEKIGMCCIELTPNALGGVALQQSNLIDVRDMVQEYRIPLVFDATRAVSSAIFLAEESNQGVWESYSQLLGIASAVTVSLSKEFGLNYGGLIATSDSAIQQTIQSRIQERGHDIGLSQRQQIMAALTDRAWIAQHVQQRIEQVATLRRLFEQHHVPVRSEGLHCVLVDCAQFFENKPSATNETLDWLRDIADIAAAPHLNSGCTETRAMVRLTIPIGYPKDDFEILFKTLEEGLKQQPCPMSLILVKDKQAVFFADKETLPDDIASALSQPKDASGGDGNWKTIKQWQVQALRRELPYEQGKVEIFEAGDGQPLVLLLPFNIGAGFYAPQLDALANNYRVIVIHCPGAGTTDACADISFDGLSSMVISVLSSLDVTEPFTLVGASFGGLTAISIAHAFPEKVKKLILLGSSFKVGNRKGEINQLSVVVEEDCNAISAAGLESEMSKKQLKEITQTCESMDPRVGLRYLDVFAQKPNLLSKVEQIDVPMLLIHGALDQVINVGVAKELAEHSRDVQLRIIENAGHFPSLTNFSEVNGLIEQFIEQSSVVSEEQL